MNTLIDTPKSAKHITGRIEIVMSSGQKLHFPVEANPRLRSASDLELADIELSPFGLHWPQLDEDLCIRGIMEGDHGQTKGEQDVDPNA
ncbi:MAG: DUF2442 domain-containing protein [Verrucomicrobiales bacterium]|nr:DUF2442 domain-containing protein [Verrucomicrobiales bacterium]